MLFSELLRYNLELGRFGALGNNSRLQPLFNRLPNPAYMFNVVGLSISIRFAFFMFDGLFAGLRLFELLL